MASWTLNTSSYMCYHLMFPVPPVIKEGSPVVTANIGQDTVLPCEVEEGSSVTVMWRKDGFPITQNNK